MGSKSQTQTTSQTTTPVNQQALQDIYKTVSGAASTPYQAYNGELVAPVNQQQTAGINAINNAAGYASPYIQNAANLVQGAANPLTASQIQQYQNPYTQSVINATQAQFNDQNAQAQNALKGSAASAGALGGDRQAVAQTTLAKNQAIAQNPVIAGLYSQGYNQAVQTAQQQFQQNPLAAASSLGNLGVAGQNAALQGANAQVGAGTLQQQTQQQADQAALQQWQQQQAYPYAQAAFLQQYGLPTALAQGSTSNGTQTTPGANPWSQILGLGTAALTAFSDERVKENIKEVGKTNDGQPIYKFNYIGSPMTQIGLMAQDVEKHKPEAVGDSGGIKTVDYDAATKDAEKYAFGGSLPYGGVPYIPIGGASNARLDSHNMQFAKPQDSGSGDAAGKFLGSLASKGSGLFGSSGGFSGAPAAMGTDAVMGLGGLYADGGFVDAIHKIHGSIRRATGGAVGNTPFQSYADGGLTFSDRWSPLDSFDVPKADNASPFPVIQAVPEQAMEDWRKGVDKPNDALVADAGMPGPDPSVSSPTPSPPLAPTQTAGLPKAITNPDDVPEQPSEAMAYSPQAPMAIAPPSQPGGMGASPMAQSPMAQPAPQGSSQPESRFGSFNPLGLSDKAREAIIAGALGVAASRSPFIGTAIAEGGLKGMGAYSQATQAEQEAADKSAQRGQEQQRIDLQAKQLAQNAEQFAKNYGLAKRRVDLSEDKTPSGYRKTDTGLEAIPGGPTDPETVAKLAKAKATSSSMDDETADFLADRVLAGDTRALIGLGRGAQGAENLAKINQLVAQKAREGKPVSDAARSILANAAQQSGYVAAERAQAQIMAKLSVYGRTAYNAMDMAERMSDEVPRTQFVPINKAINAWKTNSGDPKIVALGQAIETLTNEYARAIGGGHGTVSDKEHARERLSAAQTPEQLRAVIGTMRQEILLAEHAMPAARQQIRDVYNPSAKGEVTTIEGPKSAPGTPPVVPKAPAGVPAGSAYSPSRNQWRAPDGTIYNADGSRA